MKTPSIIAGAVAIAGWACLAGCTGPAAAIRPPSTIRYTIANTGEFVPLDPAAGIAVACTGLEQYSLADGRMEVLADVKNREMAGTRVQVQCLFLDDRGYAAGDPTPWQTVDLTGDATETVHFTALTDQAQAYTIRVRDAQ